MNILWITNIPVGAYAKRLFGEKANGLWIDPLVEIYKTNSNYHLSIVTTNSIQTMEKFSEDGICYYILPGGKAGQYKRNMDISRQDWEKLIDLVTPNLIIQWGTECVHSLQAINIANMRSIPVLVFIQGLMREIARYSQAGLAIKDLFKYVTLRDIFRSEFLFSQRRQFEKRAITEEWILEHSKGCIVENRWAEIHCKVVNPTIKVFRMPLVINEAFYNVTWKPEKITNYTIMCNASGYPVKGLHVLLKALKIVKRKYSKVKLFIPGVNLKIEHKLFDRQKKPGYWVYINDLIKTLGIEKNIEFLGVLTPKELANKLSKVHVFVLGSSIENHSSSLKEAMQVGVPCIASNVGGVSQYLNNCENGFLYRFGDFEELAYCINKLFNNSEMCMKFSDSSRRIMNFKSNLKAINKEIVTMYDCYNLNSSDNLDSEEYHMEQERW